MLLLSSEHSPPPRPALYAPLGAWGIGVGDAPTLLLLGRLERFSRLSEGVQFSTELVALPFGRFAPTLLFRHPLAQRSLRHFAAGTFGAELFPKVAQFVRIIAHNLVQAGRYHTGELLTGRCALYVQCMHMCTCAPNTERIPLYTVNLTPAFNKLMRCYAPSLDPMVYGVPMDSKEFGGLSDRHILLRSLALLCALCAVLSHAPMLYPSEAPRKPSEAILAPLLCEVGLIAVIGWRRCGLQQLGVFVEVFPRPRPDVVGEVVCNCSEAGSAEEDLLFHELPHRPIRH
jgi:hypothetical protein